MLWSDTCYGVANREHVVIMRLLKMRTMICPKSWLVGNQQILKRVSVAQ